MGSRVRHLAWRLLPEKLQPFADALATTGSLSAAVQALRRPGWLREQRELARIAPGSTLDFRGHRIVVNDPPNVRVLCRDLFDGHIYGFRSERRDPRILDCGSNIGMSVIYFKDLYPAATIVALEPDPAIFPYLEENVRLNGLDRVELVHAAVADRTGTLTFFSDAKYASRLVGDGDSTPLEGRQRFEVAAVRLDSLLNEPVDFMKMNIEGAETRALEAAGEALRNVREMIIEYHHLPGLPRTLHRLLAVLAGRGFEYLVHDYYGQRHGPFSLARETRAFPLIHAVRND
jgi:FkbM family methyltransferase